MLAERLLATTVPDIYFIPIGQTLERIAIALSQLSLAAALVGGIAAHTRALLGGGHRYSFTRRLRPRSSSFWSTSSSDFEPKFVMARSSSSVFWTS